MHIISQREFRTQPQRYLSVSRDDLLVIENDGLPMAVVMSPQRFEQLQDLEDSVSASLAERGLPVESVFVS